MKIKHLLLLCTVNLLLVEFIHILTAFYHPTISLILFTHSLIDASKINKYFKKLMGSIHVVKETVLTAEKKTRVNLVLPYLGSISIQTGTKLKK